MTTNKGTSQAVTRTEHDLDKEAKRVIPVDPFGGVVTEGNYATYIDPHDANTTYIGKAQIGTPTSSSLWQIKRILNDGGDTSILWAEGTDGFTNKWDDRLTYSYS